MAWLRVQLNEDEQRIVNEERTSHPNERIRERMLVLLLLHNGVTRQKAAEVVGVGRATVQRYVAAYRDGGLDGLRRWEPNRPESEMIAYRELIRESFEKQPAHTVAEACEQIYQLTGLRRGPSQVRKSLKGKFLKRRSLCGRYHPTFADFETAIQVTIDGLPTTHAEQLKTLMTLNFQQFKVVSLMAA